MIALARRAALEDRDSSPGRQGAGAVQLDRVLRQAALTLAALRRPASTEELARHSGLKPLALFSLLEILEKKGFCSRQAEPRHWSSEPRAIALLEAAPRKERQLLHARIAREILRKGGEESRFVEAIRHLSAAGKPGLIRQHGLKAAAYLKSTFQSRAALGMLQMTLDATPRRHVRPRLRIALDMAELQGRVGAIEEGIRLLRRMLPLARELSAEEHSRTLCKLAVLHSRRGDFRMAASLLEEGMRQSRGGELLSRPELLVCLNELASLKLVLGKTEDALRECDAGLRLAGGASDAPTRELALNLHATRANVHLRAYEYEQATSSFETALEIAEALGSKANQATILNNLGIVHNQCDRYESAVTCFRAAAETCLEIDEGPSLASIYGNLAVLHSKLGWFDEADRALDAGMRLIPGSIGQRQELFLAHARGLALLNQGRFGEAQKQFDDAVRLAAAMGDAHLLAFDELYRAEAMIFEGEHESAERDLVRLSRSPSGPVRKMASARLELLLAFTGKPSTAKDGSERAEDQASPRQIPYLEAWNALFLGWSRSLRGQVDSAAELIESAERFFRECGAAPALNLAIWVSAEAELIAGNAQRAVARLKQGRPANELTMALYPLLEARALLASELSDIGKRSVGDLLASAEAAFGRSRAPAWRAQLLSFRESLSRQGRLGPGRSETTNAVETDTVEMATSGDVTGSRAGIVARSSAMRRVVDDLDRLRSSDVPVLIRGETGTGKEHVARIIHDESRRADRPFRVLDCATLSSSLLEAELFGARKGSFTGIDEDREGILKSAEGGSVLIDEVGLATLEAQAKLLRVLSSHTIRPVGAEEELTVDVRFLFATSVDLEEVMRAGRFRSDLYFRLRVATLTVPPLRERPEDLAGIVQRLLADLGSPERALDAEVLNALRDRPWPGNVRELRNTLARAMVECPDRITLESLERASAEPRTATVFPRNILAGADLKDLKDRLERDFLVYHYRRLGGDTDSLGKFLGVGLRHLYRRCARLGIALRELKPEQKRRS